MSHSNLRTPWPIHFKFHRVIGIYGLTVCIFYGEKQELPMAAMFVDGSGDNLAIFREDLP
jgi:hypothetical protein